MPVDIMRLVLILTASVWIVVGCTANQSTSCEDPQGEDCPTSPIFDGGAGSATVKVTSLKPLVARPGQEVTVSGLNLSPSVTLRVGDQIVPWKSATGATATFVMPATSRPGAFAIKVGRGEDTSGVVHDAAKFMIADSAGDAYPIYMATPEKICSPEVFRDAEGELKTGTKNCGAVDIDPWDLRVGVTAGGVTGKLKVNCRNRVKKSVFDMSIPISVTSVSGGTFITAVAHGLTAGDRVRILYRVPPSTASSQVDYYVQWSDTYQFFLTTSYPGSILNMNGGTEVFVVRWGDLSPDIWDTVDDWDDTNGSPSPPESIVTGWYDHDCGGIDLPNTTADDDATWKDVSIAVGANQPGCASNPGNCTMKDKITGLFWSEQKSSGSSWANAIFICDALVHNDASDWRLPTHKEMLEAYSHGFRNIASDTLIPRGQLNSAFWTATTSVVSSHQGFVFNFHVPTGYTIFDRFDPSPHVLCVRP
jgi:hypothetical protein